MPKTRLLFSTDIHGSEKCFIKFLNAGKIYKADVLILGGDLTGKMLVPFVEQEDGSYSVYFLGKDYTLKSKNEVEDFIKRVRSIGYYAYLTTPEEVKEFSQNPEKLNEVFERMMVETMKRWMMIAEEKLKGTKMKLFISPGNDDTYSIDEVLKKHQSDKIIYCEEMVVKVDDYHEMISLGYSNITPWKCPRDIPEDEFYERIKRLASQIENMENAIFNIHCPPAGTTLDVAPKLDENLKPMLTLGGQVVMVNVGSTAVRKAIEEFQPLLGLHGHIHESKGFFKIGRTLCINPGSEYSEGIMRGFLADITEKKIKDYLFVSG